MNNVPQLYKVLVKNKSTHQDFAWPTPQGKRPGKWVKVAGEIIACRNGLHFTDWQHLGQWLRWDCDIYAVETKGAIIQHADNGGLHKYVVPQARLLEKIPPPDYWQGAIDFVNSIKNVSFFQPRSKPNKKWKVFSSRAAARAAAWAAARAAARDAARDAAWDAALLARVLICQGLKLDKKHTIHAQKRWEVWQKGYGLLCDVDGVFYVYEKP